MANDAARQLFGSQLASLTRSQLFQARNEDICKYPRAQLPWVIALSKGVGAVCDDILLRRSGGDALKSLKAFAMPIRDGRNGVVAAVVTFQEIT